MKRVRGGNDPRGKDGLIYQGGQFEDGGGYKHGHKSNHAGYADPDGFETIEAFECVEGCPIFLLDQQSGTLKSGGKKNASYSNENDGIFTPGGEQTSSFYGSEGGASRYFLNLPGNLEGEPGFIYQSKASRRDRTANGRVANTHSTVKPTALMRYLIKLVTPPGGIVLDPFAGSGSTGVSAIQTGFNAILIEQEEEYAQIAAARCRAALEPTKAATNANTNPPTQAITETSTSFSGTLF